MLRILAVLLVISLPATATAPGHHGTLHGGHLGAAMHDDGMTNDHSGQADCDHCPQVECCPVMAGHCSSACTLVEGSAALPGLRDLEGLRAGEARALLAANLEVEKPPPRI